MTPLPVKKLERPVTTCDCAVAHLSHTSQSHVTTSGFLTEATGHTAIIYCRRHPPSEPLSSSIFENPRIPPSENIPAPRSRHVTR